MVNENSSILSLLLLLSQILSANVCIIVYLDLFCAGSTHLHRPVHFIQPLDLYSPFSKSLIFISILLIYLIFKFVP
jgi:hypothetical protein